MYSHLCVDGHEYLYKLNGIWPLGFACLLFLYGEVGFPYFLESWTCLCLWCCSWIWGFMENGVSVWLLWGDFIIPFMNTYRRELGIWKNLTLCLHFLFLKCCGRVSSILIWDLIWLAANGVLMFYFVSFPNLWLHQVPKSKYSSRWMISLNLSLENFMLEWGTKMEVEKRGKGGFLQLFDWNTKSKKRLFSSKPDVPGILLHPFVFVTVVMFIIVPLVLLYSVLFCCLNAICCIVCREFKPWKR